MVITDGKPVVLVLRYILYLQKDRARGCVCVKAIRPDVPCVLSLVGSDHREKAVSLEKLASSLISVAANRSGESPANDAGAGDSRIEVRTTSDVVVYEALCGLFCPEILDGICPEEITHQAVGRWLSEAVELISMRI